MSHAIHYGSAVFEGLRAYNTRTGPVIFRLKDHITRLFASARIYGIESPYTPDQLSDACKQVVHSNALGSAYIRPILFRGAGTLGMVPHGCTPVHASVAAIDWGAYLGSEAIEHGIDVCVSSWTRPSSSSFPLMAKAAGHYLSSQLIASEARRNGYAEGLALDSTGTLSEGSSENIFLVRSGILHTPPLGSNILEGITRSTVISLAESLGIPVRCDRLPRESLYVCDELFLTGTAAEITPVRSVDRVTVGGGKRGPITSALQSAFFGLFTGQTQDRFNWLDHVETQTTRVHSGGRV